MKDLHCFGEVIMAAPFISMVDEPNEDVISQEFS